MDYYMNINTLEILVGVSLITLLVIFLVLRNNKKQVPVVKQDVIQGADIVSIVTPNKVIDSIVTEPLTVDNIEEAYTDPMLVDAPIELSTPVDETTLTINNVDDFAITKDTITTGTVVINDDVIIEIPDDFCMDYKINK